MAEVLERPPEVKKKPDQVPLEPPPKFNVVLRDLAGSGLRCHVTILMDVFNMNTFSAMRRTAEAKFKGRSIVGTYSKEVARMKAHQGREALSKHLEHEPFIQLSRFRCEPTNG